MKLENSNFENNARQSLSTFDKLKNAFKFGNTSGLDKASQSMDKLNKSSKGITLDKLRGALDTVTSKFSNLGIIGTTALMNITNRAVNTGITLAKSLSIDPIMDGFREYELKMGSIQTILANTAKDGTTLKDVNAALNDLNTYADKTIYSFAEMTKNIGTFTAAGVELEPAKQSIKGIANLAALSGSNSQQASTAMYQLSQAIAAGSVKLMDWNSVVNAGMGGQVFQDALKETARAHGVSVDAMIEKNGSFRESLQEGWITSEILTETLSKFTGDLTDAQLKQMGYTEEQIKDIQKMSKMAVESATKVRTFTQLMDTAKEAVGSTWAQFWELAIGDFEDASKRLTSISKAFESLVNSGMDPLLDRMQKLKDMGQIQKLWDSIFRAGSSVAKVLGTIKDAFRDVFPARTVQDSVKMITSFESLTKALEPSDKALKNIKSAFKGVFSVVGLGIDVVKTLAGFFIDLIPFEMSGNILDVAGSLGEFLQGATDSVGELKGFKDILGKVSGGVDKFYDAISNAVRGFTGFEKGAGVASKVFEKIGNVLARAWQGVKDTIGKIDLDDLANASFITTLFLGIKKATGFIDDLKDKFGDLFDNLDNIVGKDSIFAKLGDTLEAFQSQVKSKVIMKIAIALGVFAASLFILAGIDMASLAKGLTALGLGLSEMVLATKALSKINTGGGLKQALSNIPTMIAVASSLVLLAISLRILNGMEPGKLIPAVIAMSAVMAELVVAAKLMSNVDLKGVKSSALIGVALTMLILVKTLEPLTGYSIPELVKSISAMGAMMLELALFAKLTSNTKLGPGSALGVIGVATSLLIMVRAIDKIRGIDTRGLIKGLGTIAALLGEIAIFAKATSGSHMISAGAGLMAIATGLSIMMVPLKVLAGMSLKELVKSLSSLAVVLAELAVAARLIGSKGLAAGASIAAMAAGVLLLAPALLMLSAMSWEGIGKGLITVAGAFTVLGVTGAVLGPVAPAMLAVAGALGILGVAVLAAGAGISMAVGALQVIADAPARLVQSLRLFVDEAILVFTESVPQLTEALVLMIVSTLQAVSEHLPELIDVMVDIICGIIDGVADNMGRIGESVSNLINSIFDTAQTELSDVPIDKLTDAVLAVGAIAVVARLVSGLAPLLPSALLGIASAGVLMVEIGAVLAAVGALYDIPGVSDFVNRGGDFLMDIGNAIGKFVGGFVGGVIESVSASLPTVGTNLSDFMENAKGFIEGANSIQPGSMDGVDGLVSAILKLTAANLLNSINNFLGIFGGSSMADFGAQLTEFGKAMKNYAQQVAGIDTAAITTSVEAAEGLVQLARKVPNMGGLISFFTGDNKMSEFGSEMSNFGTYLRIYSDNVADVDVASIQGSVTATQSIIDMANTIQNSGGMVSLFTGDNSLATFGGDLADFGDLLTLYYYQVVEIDPSVLNRVTTATKHMSETLSGIESNKNLISFGNQLVNFGESLEEFYTNTTGLRTGDAEDAVNGIKNIITQVNDLASIPVGQIDALAKAIKKVGTDSIRSLKNAFTHSQNDVNSTIGTFLGKLARYTESKGQKLMKSAGSKMTSSLISGLKSKTGSLSSAATSLANAAKSPLSRLSLYRYGLNAGQGFANGMSSRYWSVYNAAASLARAASNAVRYNLRIHSPSRVMMQLADYTVQGFTNNLEKGEAKTFEAATKMSKGAVDGVKKLAGEFGNIVDNEFAYEPKIKPVVDWDNFDPNTPFAPYSVPTNGSGALSLTTSLASTASTSPASTQMVSASTVKQYTVNNEKMLEGAIFQVREEADIPRIAKEINRLERESLEAEGVRL